MSTTQATRAEKADDIIKKYALFATGAGLIPVTGLDIAGSASMQYLMVKELCELYNVDFDSDRTRTIMTSVLGGAAASGLAHLLREVIQGFGIGSESLTNGAITGFISAAVGEVHRQHFERGGTLATLNLGDYLNYFSRQIESGELGLSSFNGVGSAFSYLR